MKRRRLLGLTAAAAASTAGCVVGYRNDGGAEAADEPIPGVDLPVPAGEFETPLPRDGIPAIVDPAFASDWSGLDPEGGGDPTLPDETAVIGIERGGSARAYPLRVLDWHEVVNDDFGGPIAVTYCVLCASSVVAERVVAGEPTTFGVSGRLWRKNLVMYDSATESLWSQIHATAIQGPQTGDRLDIVRSRLSSWGEWRRSHPGTDVLLPPPRSGTIDGRGGRFPYFESKYGYEEELQLVGAGSEGDPGVRTMVVGVSDGAAARAYPFDAVEERGVVTDTVGEIPVVVAVTPGGALVAYDRRLDGRGRAAAPAGERHFEMAGSRFERSTGVAVDGPHEGVRLERANEYPPMFWRGWSNVRPDTTVFGYPSADDAPDSGASPR
jgi:hypothetical protein